MSQQPNETQPNGSNPSLPAVPRNNVAYADTIRNSNVNDLNVDGEVCDAVLDSFCEITYCTVHGVPVQTVRFLARN